MQGKIPAFAGIFFLCQPLRLIRIFLFTKLYYWEYTSVPAFPVFAPAKATGKKRPRLKGIKPGHKMPYWDKAPAQGGEAGDA
jgi:hypothetical protein